MQGRLFGFGLPLPEDADLGGQFDAAFSLKRLLRERGRLWISVPGARPELDAESRDETGRLFKPLHPEYLVLLFERLGLQLLRRWEEPDRLGRSNIRWNSFLLDTARGRPLDRIEGVLNRDRKTATYKLALFRALSEIGTLQDHVAEWLPAGRVRFRCG